jgi:hypothetical protein
MPLKIYQPRYHDNSNQMHANIVIQIRTRPKHLDVSLPLMRSLHLRIKPRQLLIDVALLRRRSFLYMTSALFPSPSTLKTLTIGFAHSPCCPYKLLAAAQALHILVHCIPVTPSILTLKIVVQCTGSLRLGLAFGLVAVVRVGDEGW